jgi:hypothetical protein
VDDHLAVMSIGFMLPNQDDAIIWRGPRKQLALLDSRLQDLTDPPVTGGFMKILAHSNQYIRQY